MSETGSARLGVIILTQDEALHLPRALESLKALNARIWVVDSGSTDSTVELARAQGAEVLHHPWTNYACQFNWAIDQVHGEVDWLLRLDADEFLDDELQGRVADFLASPAANQAVACEFPRYMTFMSEPVRFGGVFPVYVVRLWKSGLGRCEARWMDEHIVVKQGGIQRLNGRLVDDSKKSLTWWVDKHNAYANREAVDILLSGVFDQTPDFGTLNAQAAFKRWLKLTVYRRLPLGFRAWLYYCYRMYLRLGFLDRGAAREFHWLQGYWYRRLVDMKIAEVHRLMRRRGCDLREAVLDRLGIDIDIPLSSE